MSSLKALYQKYLASPDASAFAPDGSLNYITTLTTLHNKDAIAKHLNAHQRVLKKKHENILNTIEGGNGLCLEVETTIEFITGGGTYLPGLDDNFLADQLATFPIVCPTPKQVWRAFHLTDHRIRSMLSNSMLSRRFNNFDFFGIKDPC